MEHGAASNAKLKKTGADSPGATTSI